MTKDTFLSIETRPVYCGIGLDSRYAPLQNVTEQGVDTTKTFARAFATT